jgi:hypothetical protein
MKLVLVVMAAGAVGAALIIEQISEPAAWAMLLAGVAGSGFLGRSPGKNRIGIED